MTKFIVGTIVTNKKFGFGSASSKIHDSGIIQEWFGTISKPKNKFKMKPQQKNKNKYFDVFFVFFSRITCDSRFIHVLFANKMYYTFFAFYSEFGSETSKKCFRHELYEDHVTMVGTILRIWSHLNYWKGTNQFFFFFFNFNESKSQFIKHIFGKYFTS